MKNTYLIFDFDSTFISTEALDELAEITLADNPNKHEILEEIKQITNLGMEGKLAYSESLERRVNALKPAKSDIDELIVRLKNKVSKSINNNKSFFNEHKHNIYIISGGFKEWIIPIAQDFDIPACNIFANKFIFSDDGQFIDYDQTNDLAKDNGKEQVIKKLNLNGSVYIIGDGYNDYLVKKVGAADKFYAFIENINRESVTKLADEVIKNFDEFLYLHNLPRSHNVPKSRINVLILENIDKQAVSILEKEGYNLEVITGALDEQQLSEKIAKINILCIRSKTQVSKQILSKAKSLIGIGAFCIGTNQIDITSCMHNGTAVFNAPYSNSRSVAELAIGEMIILNRKVAQCSNEIQKGIWNKSAVHCNEIRGKKLGIVGYGNIGTQISVLAESIGMQVYYYDIAEKLALGNAVKCYSLADLLSVADIVTVHVDGRKNNNNFFCKNEFAKMKTGSVFINLSRGHVVNTKDLAEALNSGHLKGAALDVFPEEPKKNTDNFTSELQNIPNVLLTPHIGGSTEEAQKSIGQFVALKLIDFINTGNTTLSVNIPNIDLPEQINSHRIIHIHKNVPGVMAQMNDIFGKYNINIVGQYLKTNENLGYVITDVDKEYDSNIINQLKNIDETIRLRVLF